jgi:predicted RNA-binding protein (virulence factor B family)
MWMDSTPSLYSAYIDVGYEPDILISLEMEPSLDRMFPLAGLAVFFHPHLDACRPRLQNASHTHHMMDQTLPADTK